MEQGDRLLAAHDPGDRDTHTEGPQDPLDHDKPGQADAVEETDTAEEDGGQHAVKGIGL